MEYEQEQIEWKKHCDEVAAWKDNEDLRILKLERYKQVRKINLIKELISILDLK